MAFLTVSVYSQAPVAENTLVNPRISKEKLLEDLALFQHIKEQAHSGIYKYRTKAQMDSIFHWAQMQVTEQSTLIDLYKLLVAITDFEGSLHNDTYFSKPITEAMNADKAYFPYPVKLIENRLRLNFRTEEIPLGSSIVAINGILAQTFINAFRKYYTTDGFNLTGKSIGFNSSFPKYFRLEYGPQREFLVKYIHPQHSDTLSKRIEAVDYKSYQEHFNKRHSIVLDSGFYAYPVQLKAQDKYSFRVLDDQTTALLTINSFYNGGSSKTKQYKLYKQYLDSCFSLLVRRPDIKNLIVDVRSNGGGDDSDILTYSYLAPKPFRENTSAFISFRKIPYWKYVDFSRNFLVRFIAKRIYQWKFRKEFNLVRDGQFYQNSKENPVRQPQPNAFKGKIYLLISPAVASAGSLFAALVRGNTEATVIGEETQGGYYGHNGHVPVTYQLPKTQIKFSFSIVNLEQNVPAKATQPPGRGIIPDYEVSQTFEDFMHNRDTQMEFTLRLIEAQVQGKR